ncbi:MAG: hypothetical protein GY816_04260 [Cytophagales bacterium]|nr:hypothetical protein [Cytophagales bacterium]
MGFENDGIGYYGAGYYGGFNICNAENPNTWCYLPRNDFWQFNSTTNEWSQLGSSPYKYNRPRSVIVNNKIFTLGKSNQNISYTFHDFYEYTPSDDQWQIKSQPPLGVYPSNIRLINHDSFVYMIFRENALSDDEWIASYDPALDSWTEPVELLFEGVLTGSYSLDNIIYVINHLGQLFTYGPSSQNITEIETPLSAQSMIVFDYNGQLYIGGISSGEDKFYRFDPDFTK